MFRNSMRLDSGVAGKGDQVTFTDADGVQHSGVALSFQSDRMAVGVQDAQTPTVIVEGHRKDGSTYRKRVPNNSVWVVPYTAVVGTHNGSR